MRGFKPTPPHETHSTHPLHSHSCPRHQLRHALCVCRAPTATGLSAAIRSSSDEVGANANGADGCWRIHSSTVGKPYSSRRLFRSLRWDRFLPSSRALSWLLIRTHTMRKLFLVISTLGLVSCEAPLQFGEVRVNGVTVHRGFVPMYQPTHRKMTSPKTTTLPKGVVRVQTPKGIAWRVKPTGKSTPVLPPGYHPSKLPLCLACGHPFGDHRWDDHQGWMCKHPPKTKVPLKRH